MMVKKDPDTLIGKRYDEQSYHCYDFIVECLDVPSLDDISVATAESDIRDNTPFYKEIDIPVNYCIIVLGKKHIGIFKDGYIYHNDRDCVKAESMRTMQRKYTKMRYYDVY